MQNGMTAKQRKALGVYVKLMRASNLVTRNIHRHLQDDALTHSQFAVLEALYHLGPLIQSELSRKILKSNANLTAVVDSLEQRQLVARGQAADDRRKVTVELTEAGRQLVAQVFPRHAKIVEAEFSRLNALEQETLAALLKKLGLG